MANNPNVNKVVYGNQTVMDITDTTAEEGDVVSGKTFYKASGARSTGSAVIPDISNCYQTTDTAETAIADNDYFPFYDTSATAKRKTLWSNIKAKLKAYFDGIYSTFSGSYNDLTDKPTIPAAQVNSDWNANSGVAEILNKPSLATVATSGSYNDLSNKPTIPAAQIQSDWNQTTTTAKDFIKNKPTIPAAQIQSDWNQTTTTAKDYIKNKPTIYKKGVYYGTCTSQAANQTKAVTIAAAQGFTLEAGATIYVKFDANNTYSATADAPVKLNVNSTGAKNVYYGGSSTPTGTNTTVFGRANYINQYIYDGTYWVWTGSSADNNTTYSAMSVSELTTGTATTARSVRADYLKSGINSLIDTKINALDVTGASNIAASKTIKAWSETDGKVSVTTQDISITKSQVSDFPTLATVATSGSYNDLSNKPTVDKVKQNTNTTGTGGHNLLAAVTSGTTAETNYVEKTADMKYYPYYRELRLTDTNGSEWTMPQGLAYELIMGVYNLDAGDTLRFPRTGTDSHIHTDCVVIPVADSKSDGTGYKFRSLKVYNGYAELVLGEDTPAATVHVGLLIYDFTTRYVQD